MTIGWAICFTSDMLTAKISAGRLFKLLDRKSDIDVNDAQGECKVNFHIFKYMCLTTIRPVQIRLSILSDRNKKKNTSVSLYVNLCLQFGWNW